jgi:hypothetical protein
MFVLLSMGMQGLSVFVVQCTTDTMHVPFYLFFSATSAPPAVGGICAACRTASSSGTCSKTPLICLLLASSVRPPRPPLLPFVSSCACVSALYPSPLPQPLLHVHVCVPEICRTASGSGNFGSTLPSAAAAGGSGTFRAAGNGGSYEAAAAGVGTGTLRAGSIPYGTGTVRSAVPPSAAAAAAEGLQVITGPAAAAAGAGGGQKSVYTRLPSLQQLSVDVNALNPEASSAADGGLAGGGAGGGAIPIMASRLVWQDGSATAAAAAAGGGGGAGVMSGASGDGGVVLARVLLPALQTMQAPTGAGAPQLQVSGVYQMHLGKK